MTESIGDSSVERALKALADAVTNMEKAVFNDDKTTLGNALALRAKLNRCVGETEPSVLFMGDLDSFKEVNSKYGYEGGDAAIDRTGTVLAQAIQVFDNVLGFRQGGDEFSVVCPERIAAKVAKALGTAFEEINVKWKPMFEVRGSFGYASYEKSLSVEQWKERAELALIHAKKDPKVRVVAWSESLQRTTEKLRRRCSECSAAFSVEPTKQGIAESDLFCPQCGHRSTKPEGAKAQ